MRRSRTGRPSRRHNTAPAGGSSRARGARGSSGSSTLESAEPADGPRRIQDDGRGHHRACRARPLRPASSTPAHTAARTRRLHAGTAARSGVSSSSRRFPLAARSAPLQRSRVWIALNLSPGLGPPPPDGRASGPSASARFAALAASWKNSVEPAPCPASRFGCEKCLIFTSPSVRNRNAVMKPSL